jgi:hypothetical protein
MVNDVCVVSLMVVTLLKVQKRRSSEVNNMVKEFDYEKIYSFIFSVFERMFLIRSLGFPSQEFQ